MIILRDTHGNPMGSTVQVSPSSGGLVVVATSDFDGGAINAMWTLQPSGLFSYASKVHGQSLYAPGSPSYFGTLLGFDGPPAVQQITMGPVSTVTVIANPPNTSIKTVRAVLIAKVGGSTASLMIEIQPLNAGS